MIRNFDINIQGLDGNDLIDEKTKTTIVARDHITNALTFPFSDEPNLTGTDKIIRFNIAQKIHKGGDVELDTDELALVKSLTAKYSSIVAWGFLENLIEKKKQVEPKETTNGTRKNRRN